MSRRAFFSQTPVSPRLKGGRAGGGHLVSSKMKPSLKNNETGWSAELTTRFHFRNETKVRNESRNVLSSFAEPTTWFHVLGGGDKSTLERLLDARCASLEGWPADLEF